MANNKEQIQPLKIKELFASNDKYIIPIYQRNYAWQKAQVTQLIQDIMDVSKIDNKKKYYIGTLVVYKRSKNNNTYVYETIDGQQRLTTLSILLSVLKNTVELDFIPNKILTFESRGISKNTLNNMYDDYVENDTDNPTMKQAYIDIQNKLKQKNINLEKFTNFLLNNVEILRVQVPEDTDLNHYFEIMNNRGEQLEKHEVLKANMMSSLNSELDRLKFAKIWDACSDMSRYVQYGFNVEDRKEIFGDKWNTFKIKDFDSILKDKEDSSNIPENSLSLNDIIKKEFDKENENNEKDFERFISPINFQNFLLHVLRIQIADKQDKNTLDDKRLLDIFKEYLKDNNKERSEKFVKQFTFNLLKLKYLFDNFIIKRDYKENTDDGKWSLLKLFDGNSSAQYNNSFDDNQKIIMLLSMFHVSNPSQNYKHWLTGVLNFLYSQDTVNYIDTTKYIEYLENMAKLFLMNRYLANVETSYNEIIFNTELNINEDIDRNNLNQGTKVENFIFNYLDYLLWKRERGNYSNFLFSFKSSVEHVYPQHPKDGQKEFNKIILDSFGNLCLISASKNSELSNHMPIAKLDSYNATGYDSLKQELMMEIVKKKTLWDENTIKEHQEEMENILFHEPEQ